MLVLGTVYRSSRGTDERDGRMTIKTIWTCDVCGAEKPVIDVEHNFDGWHTEENREENSQICLSCLRAGLLQFEKYNEPGCVATLMFHRDISHWLFPRLD